MHTTVNLNGIDAVEGGTYRINLVKYTDIAHGLVAGVVDSNGIDNAVAYIGGSTVGGLGNGRHRHRYQRCGDVGGSGRGWCRLARNGGGGRRGFRRGQLQYRHVGNHTSGCGRQYGYVKSNRRNTRRQRSEEHLQHTVVESGCAVAAAAYLYGTIVKAHILGGNGISDGYIAQRHRVGVVDGNGISDDFIDRRVGHVGYLIDGGRQG